MERSLRGPPRRSEHQCKKGGSLGIVESDLKVYRDRGAYWDDVTTSVDTTNKLIAASGISSLSLFVVGSDVPAPPAGSLVCIR